MRFLLPLLIIGIPIAEIAMFIQVGDLIGLWPTLATIVLTAVIGATILRHQGLATIAKAQSSLDHGQLPIDSVIHGLFLLVAGALLLTPGFLTDAVGFIFLIPPVRLSIARWIMNVLRQSPNVHVSTFDMGRFDQETTGSDSADRDKAGPIIEGEIVEEDKPSQGGDGGDSPWRR